MVKSKKKAEQNILSFQCLIDKCKHKALILQDVCIIPLKSSHMCGQQAVKRQRWVQTLCFEFETSEKKKEKLT